MMFQKLFALNDMNNIHIHVSCIPTINIHIYIYKIS